MSDTSPQPHDAAVDRAPIDRRTLLGAGALALAIASSTTLVVPRPAAARVPAGRDPFPYEVVKTDAEWREQLGDEVFQIMRQGQTEEERSSPLWDEMRPGRYSCKGCDLEMFTHVSKKMTSKGWVFFRAGQPNALLMSIDGPPKAMDNTEFAGLQAIEAHCRRCGSHIGHILPVMGDALHCLNGAALVFRPETA